MRIFERHSAKPRVAVDADETGEAMGSVAAGVGVLLAIPGLEGSGVAVEVAVEVAEEDWDGERQGTSQPWMR